MTDFACKHITAVYKRKGQYYLLLTWVLGLLIGSILSILLKPYFLPLMRSVFLQPVSIVGFVTCIFIPLLFTFLFYIFRKPICIFVICFTKAAAYGFTGTLVSQIFPNSSWLFRPAFLFSDCCFLIVLLMLWSLCLSAQEKIKTSIILACTIIGVLIAGMDYFVISPILLRL